ncbi:MAG: mechanosensitive ion channel [Promethearchaeota archaeon]|nr:MAG: mechanosensitive ion channel [Candidatus Lokiarchaeota archaeon]
MAIFNTDFEAAVFIIIIGIILYVFNKIIFLMLSKIKRVSAKQENKIGFILSLISFIIIVYLIIEGFPSFEMIDPTYSAILTGAISTALAFASRGIFSNIVSGIVLMIISPADVGDVVKIKGTKGIIRQITLSNVVIETFEGVIVQFSNTDVLNSTIINYTKKIGRIKDFETFKKEVASPQVSGLARIETIHKDYLKKMFEKASKMRNPIIHKYTFKMEFPYEGFHSKLTQAGKLCKKYTEVFGAKPWYDIVDYGLKIKVKFIILTLDSTTIMNDQPKFAKDLYKIILRQDN